MEIIKTKLMPPRIKPGMIKRNILNNPLLKEKRIILINAPAGYGKTTIMLQLLQQYELATVWYQLDAYDNDPAVFFQYLIAGFQQFLPNFGEEAMVIIKQGDFQNNLRLILGKFINSLAQSKEKISLVLDDFQAINEPVIHRFIQEFLERLPENNRLLIASRTTLPLSLSRLMAAGEISIIDSNELRFNRDEIKEYLGSCRQDPTESFIDHIESNTNGWPVALGLTKAFMAASQTNSLSLETKEIYTYLAGEVLANQPEAIREFLIATSVLDELTPEYCDLLLERSDSVEILGYLEKQQLFLTVLDKFKPGETLLLGGNRYQLKADFYETDWHRFEGLCSAFSADSFDHLKRINLLEEALSLYRGDYLEELDYQWLLPYRQRYKNLYLQTGVNLARLYIETKEFQKAINLVDRLMETDSFLEEAHVLAMTAYAGMGDRVGVIRYYRKTAELFRLELGLSPPAKAVELYQKVVGS